MTKPTLFEKMRANRHRHQAALFWAWLEGENKRALAERRSTQKVNEQGSKQ